MERLFYSILVGILIGFAAALWLPRGKAERLASFLDPMQAQAQAIGPSRPYPAGQHPEPWQGPREPTTTSRPENWPIAGDTEPDDGGGVVASEDALNRFPPPPLPDEPQIPDEAEPQDRPRWPAAAPGDQDAALDARINEFEGAQILARVGGDVILAADVLPLVNEVLEANADKIPPDQVDEQRLLLTKQRLARLIETKVVLVDARRTIPKENWADIQKQANKQFEETELKTLFERTKTTTRGELLKRLKELGTSIEAEQRAFAERMLAQQWLRQQIKKDEEVRHEDIVAWYREHLEEYDLSAKTRWEQLTVRFDRYPDKAAAWGEIARMGNQVLDGRSLADVARESSHGLTASKGGQRDWTTKGSLTSTVLDEALFTIPPKTLSRVIEDQQGFHIIRVIERRDAGRVPFEEAQVEIRDKIKEQRRNDQIQDYLARITQEVKVATIFDPPASDSSSASVPERPPR